MLETISLFAGLSPSDRARVATVARQLHWDTGHIALREGEFAFDLYAIEQGSVEVQHHDQRIAVLGAGDCFGELGISRPDGGRWSRRRSASVLVTAPTDVIAIDGAEIRRLSDEIPALRDALRDLAAAHEHTETA
jgi:CRP-like cAMP-binding protein